ncbi:hypothetical protein PMAYCL1PPCAC_07928 [Pristionchus mayeri]|uniref:RING-type E3 ubiquitin transferase n=1 Tax=Pristionchus mayeri TaxID=1317129 RepID=A0AAN4ZAT5_9BILA|nr:hypothetical protein PMAYCL1PPCAC_07928 [Pristionchus mayeri]
MPETAEGAATSGGGGSNGRGRNGGGGRNRNGGGGGGGNRGGGSGRGPPENSGGNNRRGGGGENNGRRSPQHQQGGKNEQRAKEVGKHKVDMRKYERMITATQSNFSDIKITDPITEDCLICCKPNDIFGVGACRHPLCIECAIRIRVIANQEGCPVCRQPMETMSFVFASSDLTTVSLSHPSIHPDEKRYKVCFQNKEACARYEKYLSHVCKLCVVDGERKEFPSFVSLRQHMAQTHQLSFCHHCLANLQLFSRERTTYNRAQLQEHIRGGDRDDRSQKGHPKCLFCEERFFDEDDRYRHLRREHFFCQLCETTGAAANVFFGKHDELLKHYDQKHFLCEVDECKKAGIAFATKLDLDIHTSREHGKVNLAVDFSFNDRQVGGPARRGGRQHGGPSHAQPPPPQGPRGVGLVPAAEPPPPRSDPSQFVVVPSAQASRPNLRYARQGGFTGLADSEAFPSLGPSLASSSNGINYASGPPVVVPSEFPRLKTQPNRPPPPPAVSAANIASGAAKKKEKKKETREEAFPTLGGGVSRQQHQQQQEAPQWARHTERFDVIDDDERDAFQVVGSHGRMGPPPRVGPAVQPSRVAMVQRPATQPQPRGKQPAPMPSSSGGEDFPSLPPSARIDYGRVGGPLAQSSKWGKKASEQKKRPPPPPLPEPEMWPAMSSSTPARPIEDPDWQEVSIPLSKKALAKKENAEKNARKKEEKRLAREAREAEERAAVRVETEEESEEEEEEETKKEPERVLGLSEISRLITSAPPTETKKEKGKGREQTKEERKEEAKTTSATTTNSKKKEIKRVVVADSAPSRPSIDKAAPAPPPSTVPSQSSSLGLIGSVLCLLAALCKLLFNSVYSTFVGSGDATAATQNGSVAKAAAVAAAEARGLSTAPPPGISFAPPPGFGPPPGFENAVKRS